jgi:hypothetical protein
VNSETFCYYFVIGCSLNLFESVFLVLYWVRKLFDYFYLVSVGEMIIFGKDNTSPVDFPHRFLGLKPYPI